MKELTLVIQHDGSLLTVYDDSLVELFEQGAKVVRRASNVEPLGDGWQADMAPVCGPKLPACALRADALAAEVSWLQEHLPTLELN